ncbi:hypothetical protein IQ268_29105 [Oculatella sp. LEGE 06141]|uniref:hypothetical protein n=1 Tax=Oculatella sp. LEGE 06141 TaxID=1828648 RepID=UPI00187E8691|nr:hypothetical protein [Oculatella sp. LEGE 06141]MBE9182612.1 hypothetical protein [Oculatella sp. LEGE 06141]
MRFLLKFIGFALLLTGIYFLGQNILFTTQTSPYWWRDISASASVLAVTSGVIALLFFGRATRSLGWGLVALGILLVFVSGGVVLRPTSLWTFFLAFTSLAAGMQLITTGRVSF